MNTTFLVGGRKSADSLILHRTVKYTSDICVYGTVHLHTFTTCTVQNFTFPVPKYAKKLTHILQMSCFFNGLKFSKKKLYLK
jgi:hypothetical protein